MSKVTGACSECGGKVLALDPQEDRVLYAIFGDQLVEHKPGCPDYPETKEVSLADL